MKYYFALIAGLLFLSNPLKLIADTSRVHCAGGDGPHPLVNISNQFIQPPVRISTEGGVKDFVYWPNRQSIVYRNEHNKLFRKDLYTEKNIYLNNMESKMSRVLDPHEQYVLTERNTWYLDSESPNWGKFESPYPVTHLFWHPDLLQRNNLYSLGSISPWYNKQLIQIFKYTAGVVKPVTCNLPIQEGERYHVGSGHTYPNAFLYKVSESPSGSVLSLYKITVRSTPFNGTACDLIPLKTFPQPIPGKIQVVYQMSDMQTFAIVTNLASTNKLYWESPEERQVCSFGDAEPVILNTRQPTVASWSPKTGLNLLFPDERAEAQILEDLSYNPIGKDQLWLTDDGMELFISAKKRFSDRKMLYRMELTRD